MCGIAGVFGHPRAARLTAAFLFPLQHRGTESVGIVSTHQGRVCLLKSPGLIKEVFDDSAFQALPGDIASGHVRYSTSGSKQRCYAQPVVWKGREEDWIALSHNGNLVNDAELKATYHLSSQFDSETALKLIALMCQQCGDFEQGLLEALAQLVGAFSFLIQRPDALYAVCDPWRNRPLVIGRFDGVLVFASETCAFEDVGAEFIREVEPGEIVRCDSSGLKTIGIVPIKSHPQRLHQCIFEHVYFARPHSDVFGRNVAKSRRAMGRQLAIESPVEADVVVPVPDSGIFAAEGFAEQLQIPLRHGLTRNHYVGRTFMKPDQDHREAAVREKLSPVKEIVQGQRVVLVDDSIVRGTTSRRIVGMVREAGAREVHVRISCPPTIAPCFYGIDTPTRTELIGEGMDVEAIRDYLQADSLRYLSLSGLRHACGEEPEKPLYCVACFTGQYPIGAEQIVKLL